ncbi:MAG TPA: hypothetical protein VM240_12600 [Verrucomicrobiae bacterium]|nr:hypothetical protein [Verrucomicrobiae bacterium]
MHRLVAVAAVLLSGCTTMPTPVHVHRGADTGSHLEYLARAMNTPASQREAIWQAAVKEPTSAEATLHRALLRTVSGHSGYDLIAAETELQQVLATSPSIDIAPVARARLEDVRAINACRQEADGLKKRLAQVADMEKRLDQGRR